MLRFDTFFVTTFTGSSIITIFYGFKIVYSAKIGFFALSSGEWIGDIKLRPFTTLGLFFEVLTLIFLTDFAIDFCLSSFASGFGFSLTAQLSRRGGEFSSAAFKY